MWSGGKDSTANIILAHLKGEPVSKIIMSEVMFTKEISGELPAHMNWVRNVAIPLFESWGYEVEIVHADKTFMDCFNRINQGRRNPSRKGKKYGFPMSGKCIINTDCKVKPLKDYLKNIKGEYKQYVGIACDEPERIEKMKKDSTKISLLVKYGYNEKMAKDLCNEYGLLSPMYSYAKRGGCWFCPNARDCQLREVRDNHNDLWQMLLALEDEDNLIGDVWNTRSRISIHDKEIQFAIEDENNAKYQQINMFDYYNLGGNAI